MNLLHKIRRLLFVPLCALLFAQQPFREFIPMEGRDSASELPPDFKNKAELVLGRLMYPSSGRGRGGGGSSSNWLSGGTNWTVDYPRGDRTFAGAIRRLTRIDVRSVEQPVNPDEGNDIFYWPYLHVGMPTTWNLTDAQAAKIREYLLRGGFMLCDSYFGDTEWAGFEVGLKKIFPDRDVEDLPDGDPIFHTVFDITDKYQVANFRSLQASGRTYRGNESGKDPKWRVIRDARGRVMIMMTFNNDLGDSWQLADNPAYAEKYSSLGIRLGVNFVVYTMTH